MKKSLVIMLVAFGVVLFDGCSKQQESVNEKIDATWRRAAKDISAKTAKATEALSTSEGERAKKELDSFDGSVKRLD